MRSRPIPLFLASLALGAGSVHAVAQPSGEPAIPMIEHRHATQTARSLIARQLARIAVSSIRTAGPTPTPNDFILTGSILQIACELDPTNLDLLRRQIDAWHGAGDRERTDALTARLVELDPQDRVAQLRLLSSRINALQTAEQRLAAFDRVLGPAGASLDPAIRSRLALDAALLARERGDEAGFSSRLTLATQLDKTNKDAAALAASVILEAGQADALARAEALLNVVIADPMDASSHANLARALRNSGAFDVAMRFQDNASAIYAAEGRYFTADLTYERLLTVWGAQGPEAVVNELDQRERLMRTERANTIAAYQAAGQQPPPGPAPEHVTIEQPLEILRAAANIALGRSNRVATTTRLISQQVAAAQQVIRQAQQQNAPPEQLARAAEELKAVVGELLWLRLWSGADTVDAEALLDSLLSTKLISEPDTIARSRGLLAMRKGDFAQAEALLAPLVDKDPRARIGMALLDEARGNPRAAAARLAPLAMEQAGSMLGLYARSTIERLLQQPVAPSPDAIRLSEYFRSVPRWLDSMTRDPREFMVIEAFWPAQSIGVLDGLPLTIRLRNLGRTPLPVGPNLTINSRLLLSPDVAIGGHSPENRLAPEVAEFSRSLRVMPGESTEITVQTGLGIVGAALDNGVTQVATLRWQIAQGFLLNPQGGYLKGPTSVSTTSPLLTRRRVSIPDESPDGVRRSLEGAQGERVFEVLLALRDLAVRAMTAEDRQAASAVIAAVIESVAARMDTMTELDRAAAVLLVGSIFPRETRTPIDERAFADPAHLVRTAALLARVNNPDDPAFDALKADGSPALDTLVDSMRERMRAAIASQEALRRQQQQQQQQQQRPGQPQNQGLRFDPSAK